MRHVKSRRNSPRSLGRTPPRESFGGKGSNVGFRSTAAQGDAAGIRFNKAAERAEQRRFAAAVWADDAGDFAKTLVSHGRYPYLGFSRTLSDKDRTVIQNALKTAGVSAFADRRLPMLSGGERQRVFLAMLLAQNTDVVLLDEPTTYLDAHHKFELMALLSTLKAQNKAVGIVLHELPLAFKFCDRLLLMKNGQIMQSGTPEELLKTGLIEHLFGISLTPVMLDKEVEYIERKIHS